MPDTLIQWTKSQTNYRFDLDVQGQRCGQCRFYLPVGLPGACRLVAGPIRPDAVCDLFEPQDVPESGSEAERIQQRQTDDTMAPDQVVAMSVKGEYTVAKADDTAQNVFGWAYISISKDGEEVVDHSGEVIDIDELEKASYDFVLRSRVSGEDHDGGEVDGQLIEAMVFTDEKLEALAKDETGEVDDVALQSLRKSLPLGLWVGFHISDRQAFERAKSGKGAFSIEGTAERVAA